MPLHVSSTCAHHQEVKIALHSLWYHHTVPLPLYIYIYIYIYLTHCKTLLHVATVGEQEYVKLYSAQIPFSARSAGTREL